MRKSKKILSVTLALIIALSTLIVGTSAITVNAATPSKVTLVSTAYNTNATVTLGWTAASGANGYQIAKKRITDKGYTYLTATGTSYNDKKVITGTIYYYQVRAFYKSGKNITYGAWSNSKSITTLYRPTVTSLNYLNNNLLNINWNKILGVSHYRLAFKRTIDKAWNYRNVKNTYFNVSNPTKGTTYTIQVCPMNGTLAGQWSLVKSITIKYVPVKVSSIKLSQTSLSLTLGNSKTLSATVTPSNADNKVLQWSSSNTKVATVNQSGKVTSVSTGTATIYAKATDGSGKQAACSVAVNGIKVSSITVNPTSVSLKPGETKSITATVSPANAENKNLQWTSSNTKVATVNQSGTVTAVSDGTATIYVKATDGSGKQATCSVTVTGIKVSSITVNPTSVSLKPGETKSITATVSPSNAENKNLQWTSSNTKVATVNQSGTVTAVSDGTATIYARASDGSGKQAACSVTVAGIKVSSITLSKTSLNLKQGDSETITATIAPSNADNKTLQWTSSNTKAATVSSSGKITAVGAGTTTIRALATDNSGVSATCTVTVVATNPDAEYIENYNKLANYIRNNYDSTSKDGYKRISKITNGSNGVVYYDYITVTPSGGLNFLHCTEANGGTSRETNGYSAIDTNFNNSFMIKPQFLYDGPNDYLFGCDTTVDAREYNVDNNYTFYDLDTGRALSKLQNDVAVSGMKLAFLNWNYMIVLKTGMELQDIGFKSYSYQFK